MLSLLRGHVCVSMAMLLWTLPSIATDVLTGLTGHEKQLFLNVTSGYNTISRPVRDASRQVNMTFGLSLNQIIDLDEKHQVLSTYVWIYEKWTDENLQWDPADFNGLEKVMFPATHIWVPDIYIFNTAGSPLDGFVNVTGSYVVVRYDGGVEWSIPLQIKSACPVDATYFPYDKQSCSIHFGSWIYDFSQINIELEIATPDLSNYVINNEFDLDQTTLIKDMVNSSCCPGNGDHPMVHLEMRLKRKTIYYDYIVIAPTINLCVLTLATFLLPCECGWKIAIGLTVFLTLYVLQLLIAENVPDTNSTPLISVFLLLVMSLNCISLIMATVIMNVKKRSQQDPIPKVPPLVLNICEKYLSKIICTKFSDWKKIATAPKDEDDILSSSSRRYRSYRERLLEEVMDDSARQENIQALRLANIVEEQSERLPITDNCQDHPMPSESPERSNNGRTQTAESSFSTASGGEPYDSSATDKLWDSKKHRNSPRKHHPNINNSFTIEEEESDELSMTPLARNYQHYSAVCSNGQKRYSISQSRPSYKRAVRGVTYSAQRPTYNRPRKLHRRPFKKTTFFSGVDRKYQWYFVADVIDTTTFFIYIVVMFVGIMTVLVIVPIFA